MALNITIADADEQLVLDAFRRQYGYADEVPGDNARMAPNPQSIEDFTIQQVKNWMATVVTSCQQATSPVSL